MFPDHVQPVLDFFYKVITFQLFTRKGSHNTSWKGNTIVAYGGPATRSARMKRERACMEITCPGCGSKDVRRSHGQDLLSTFLRQFRLQPFRCRSCRKRFFKIGKYQESVRDNQDEGEASPGQERL